MVLSLWVFSGWHSQLLSGTNCSSYSNICKELQIAIFFFYGHKKEWAREGYACLPRARARSFLRPLFPNARYAGYKVG